MGIGPQVLTTVFSLKLLTMIELTTSRYFIVLSAKLNQHILFKGTLTLKLSVMIYYFGKELLLLFTQRMRSCGFLSGQCGLMKHEPERSS